MRDMFNRATQNVVSLGVSIIEDYLPTWVEILKDKGGPHVVDLLDDDERMEEIILVTYQALPLPARLAIKQSSFTEYVHTHKEKIREALLEKADSDAS